MLDEITAAQFAEWMQFEREFGPIDNDWRDEIMAQVHELIQKNNLLTGMALTSKKNRKNPAGKTIEHVPRPEEVFKGGEVKEEEE